MTNNQKQWVAWAVLTAVTLALSFFLGVRYPLPEPPEQLPDQIVTAPETEDQVVSLGVTHMTALELSGSETDELVVNQTSTGDIVEFRDNGTVVWRLADGGNIYHNGELDLNGQKLDLDADADTSIEADTDDQIDWELGGADIFVMKQWGASNITTDTTEHLLEIQDSTPVMTAGTNSLAGLNIDMGIGNSTAGTNAVYGILIDSISQDAQNTEDAIAVGSGWDYAADFDSGVTIDGGMLNVGTGSCGVADGDNDVCIAAVLEVDGELEADGAIDADSTLNVQGAVTFQGAFYPSFTDLTITGGPTYVTPTYTIYALDAGGAVSMTLQATGTEGQILILIGDDNQTITVNDANIRTSDGNAVTIGQYDVVMWVYQDNEWMLVSSSANS